MKLLLNLDNNQVVSVPHPQGGKTSHFKEMYVFKDSSGWCTNCAGFDFTSAENVHISPELLEITTGFFWKIRVEEKHFRQEGVYEFGDVKIVVRNVTPLQEIEFIGRSVDTFRRALVALRNGELHPKYPLVRKQEAPTYDELASMMSYQTETVRRLTEQIETSNKVVNHGQCLLLSASTIISDLKETCRILQGQLTGT